ncbi:MAG: hypothetical protein AAFN92_03825 [Bacteroidota bacterium]
MDRTTGLVLLFTIIIPLVALAIALYAHAKARSPETQRLLSDRDLLELIQGQPDQLLTPHQLRDASELTLTQARGRLSDLFMYGILTRSYNSKGRYFYGLSDPLSKQPDLELSPEPFLTVEDLLALFDTYGNQITAQEMIVATGLPLAIIKRELKHFEKEGIVQVLKRSQGQGMTTRRFIVLKEPYRSNPEQFRQKAGVLDLELKEILRNDNLLV